MKALVIETSSNNKSVGLYVKGEWLEIRERRQGRIGEEDIIEDIKEIFDKFDMRIKDIDVIGVGIGPGSFTSLRIGLSIVKGLSFARQIPIITISSLLMIAKGIKINGRIIVMRDAKRKKVYVAKYKKEGDNFFVEEEEQLILVSDFVKGITKNDILVGDFTKECQKEMIEQKKDNIRVEEELNYSNIKNIEEILIRKYKERDFINIKELKPKYLYQEDCQVSK